MAHGHGGNRPGAGRKRKLQPALDPRLMPDEGTPLAYMLDVINDESADSARRDKMAIAAAPYFHGGALQAVGKKAREQLASERAAEGTHWEKLVN